jgi:hypothetical protein
MRSPLPRALPPNDGLRWLGQAARLLLHHPLWFVAAALLAPAGTALLLTLPIWNYLPLGGWLAMIATVSCYGLPLGLSVSLACGFARAVNRQRPPPLRQLLHPAVLRLLLRVAVFTLVLLLQGYLALYLVHGQVDPAAIMASLNGHPAVAGAQLGVVGTLLGTQLNTLGSLLLVMQFLFAVFIIPLHLFRELPLMLCWRLSFLGLQRNPWLLPGLGLPGLALLLLAQVEWLSVLVQVLALPLPAWLGAWLYVAWVEVFQGGMAADANAALHDPTGHPIANSSQRPAAGRCRSAPAAARPGRR